MLGKVVRNERRDKSEHHILQLIEADILRLAEVQPSRNLNYSVVE
jgi:hypothetical protein